MGYAIIRKKSLHLLLQFYIYENEIKNADNCRVPLISQNNKELIKSTSETEEFKCRQSSKSIPYVVIKMEVMFLLFTTCADTKRSSL